MRKLYPVVFIGPQDYRRFRIILGDALPETYDEWLADHAAEKNKWDLLGFEVREVQVFPEELISFARDHVHSPTILMLHMLAFEKASSPGVVRPF
jgi:hypothetical protein